MGGAPAMVHDLGLRAGAFVLFLAILGGGVWAAEEAFGDGSGALAQGGVVVTSPEASKSAAPGSTVSFPLVVRNTGTATLDVDLRSPPSAALAARFAPATLHLAPGEAKGAYATVAIPAGQGAGAVRIPVQAMSHEKSLGSASLALAVGAPAAPAKEGDAVQVDYVGRFANGTLFDTSVRAIGEGPFPKPEGFRRDYQPIRVVLGDQAGTIEGFWRGLLGMGEGQSKTITLPPEEAYGPASVRQEVPRTQELPRLSQSYERVQHFPRNVLSQYVNSSSKVGDLLAIPDPGGNTRSYRITALDAANATLLWEVKAGDPFTIYPLWPGQSRAFEVTNTTVVFRTTPDDPDQALTFYNFWPNATRVKGMNDTVLVLETSPAAGLEFQLPPRGPQPSPRARVVELTPTAVVIEFPNQHPLGGQTLVFDLTVRTKEKVFQAP